MTTLQQVIRAGVVCAIVCLSIVTVGRASENATVAKGRPVEWDRKVAVAKIGAAIAKTADPQLKIALEKMLVFAEGDDTTLDLGSLKLTTLPPEIGQLTKLTELNLSENQLTTLPPEIGKLTNLTELRLGFNEFTTLPSEIYKLAKLTL